MTNEKLYELCKQYGRQAVYWRQKFLGLLPEVQKRKLYVSKGFNSIFEFAFKLGGVSEKQVRRVLNLEKKFDALPVLHTMLVHGEVSAHKLARVASIATKENEEELATQVQLLSKNAVEVFVKDYKIGISQNGLEKVKSELKSVPGHTTITFEDDVQNELQELQAKGVDVNQLLRAFLQQRREKIMKEKETLSRATTKTQSRYIPVQVKQLITEEHGTKCAIKTCLEPAKHIHHTQPFSMSHSHNPYFLAPLCKEHHLIAHTVNLKVHQRRADFYSAIR